ncbi:MAG: DUF1553 domain-containing protein [Planctomycetaceae bacterium]|jgi:hypothetical protein|nr:DUF1553 domain-containing protein [Planctomycetaceae bacterium]MBT6156383.1 DUF1553 domain-containing protein [Planctomycetaceae bacterium]MBT6488003.1 DUF1553 domain-containing protein [Planctomycetaceae bacterium]MBT6495264.1 DUF1553 domain-containing protein [Planctomycetaceae bacterium]
MKSNSVRRLASACLCFGLLLGTALVRPVAASEPVADDVQKLADAIDKLIADQWKENSVSPAAPADDSEFFRRVSLDVTGKIPPAADAMDFLESLSPDKRRQVVDRLLEDPGYITHFTTFWRNVMMPEVNADFQVRFLVPSFDSWLRKQLTENTQYDALVKEILTTPLDSGQNNRRNPYQRLGEASPLAFFQAKQIAPENLASATSRIFLGIRIECAQCHDHPFDTWKQEHFWSLAAFYGGIERQGNQGIFGRVRELSDRRELNIPDTETVVQAGYLDGTEPQWRFRVGARTTLAGWVTSPENPYFARTAVNRMWGHFFGVGIVDPVDDFTAGNPPSHPELLDLLAKEFAVHNFDLKFLIRAITASRTYQLTSRKTDERTDDPQLFARMAVKGLSGEQIYDSVAQATGSYRPYNARNPFSFGGNDPRGEFLETFANNTDATTARQTTILQALAMMNGQLVANATNLSQSRSLAAVAEFPGLTTAERIENLYFLTLSRKPRPEEIERLVKYVERGGEKSDPKKSLGDVFWALLNSSEFMFNH